MLSASRRSKGNKLEQARAEALGLLGAPDELVGSLGGGVEGNSVLGRCIGAQQGEVVGRSPNPGEQRLEGGRPSGRWGGCKGRDVDGAFLRLEREPHLLEVVVQDVQEQSRVLREALEDPVVDVLPVPEVGARSS